MPTTANREATHITEDGLPAFVREPRFWDSNAKMAQPRCCHCREDFRLFEPSWIRNEIGLLAPYCADLDECSERMATLDEEYTWAFRWDVFFEQIMAALGLQREDETYDAYKRLEVTFEIEELRVLVELEGHGELISPDSIRRQFSEELLKRIWAEDERTNPGAPGLSLRQRAWSQWRVATVTPDCISHPLVLDMLWLAYRGDPNAMRECARIFRLNGVPVYDAPKATNGRSRKQSRKNNAKKAHAKLR